MWYTVTGTAAYYLGDLDDTNRRQLQYDLNSAMCFV